MGDGEQIISARAVGTVAAVASRDAGNESTWMCSGPVATVPTASATRQSGYLMPLAAFILVVMGLAAVALTRSTTQTALSVTQEAITLQAFYAAETGAQLGMNNLYYDNANALTQTDIDGRCDAMNLAPAFNAIGLSNCDATISCTRSASGTASFYTITSTGDCGSGEVTSTRTVEVSAFFENNT